MRPFALDAVTAVQDLVGTGKMTSLLQQLGPDGLLPDVTERLRSHALNPDSSQQPRGIPGAAEDVRGSGGKLCEECMGGLAGVPAARVGKCEDARGGGASSEPAPGRSRNAVPWEIPVPRSRGGESPVLSPTSPLSVASSDSTSSLLAATGPPLDTGQGGGASRPPLLKTTVLGSLEESHDSRAVGHAPQGQVIKRRTSRGGGQEAADPALLLVAGRSAHSGGGVPEAPPKQAELLRPLSLLKSEAGNKGGGTFMPLSPGGILGVGLQAREGPAQGGGRESSFMERIQMSVARSNSERELGGGVSRMSNDSSKSGSSGEGHEAGEDTWEGQGEGKKLELENCQEGSFDGCI
jgi:hypothetical protein